MSQPPYSPYPQDPYSGQPSSGGPQGYPPPGGPQGYPPPGIPQQPPGYQAPPAPSSGGGYAPPPPAPPGGGYPPPPDDQFGGAPQYGQQPPQYGGPQQPQYGGQQPQFGGPPPKKKSSALKIVLIVVGVVALLCVGGVAVTFFAAKDKVEEVVDAAKITVTEPVTLGGREQITDPQLDASVSQLDSEMAKVPGATSSVGAAYGDIQKQDLVMVVAASSLSGSAQSRYDEFTSGMSSSGMAPTNMTDTDPGPLGGIAKCGDTDSSGVPMAICVWSDNGSIGMIAMLFKQKADLEKEFVAMRGEIEKKS